MPFRLVVVMGCLTVFIATHLYATSPLPSFPAGVGARAGVAMAGDNQREKCEAARSVGGEDHGPPLAASSATTDPPATPSSSMARRLLAGMVLGAITLLVLGGYELPSTAPVSSPTQPTASVSSITSFRGETEPAPPLSVPSTSRDKKKNPAEALQEARDEGDARALSTTDM
jgi:hypothetical protein